MVVVLHAKFQNACLAQERQMPLLFILVALLLTQKEQDATQDTSEQEPKLQELLQLPTKLTNVKNVL